MNFRRGICWQSWHGPFPTVSISLPKNFISLYDRAFLFSSFLFLASTLRSFHDEAATLFARISSVDLLQTGRPPCYICRNPLSTCLLSFAMDEEYDAIVLGTGLKVSIFEIAFFSRKFHSIRNWQSPIMMGRWWPVESRPWQKGGFTLSAPPSWTFIIIYLFSN